MKVTAHRLAELCTFVRGTSATLKTSPGPFPLVVTAEFRRSSDAWQLEGPAVCIPLVSSTGHGDAALHRVHYQEGKFALANLLVALQPIDHGVCHAKYLYHLLMAKKDQLLVPLMLGTANVSLKVQDIEKVEIHLPPIAEQRRIVARIEELAAQIAEARALRDQTAVDLESMLVGMAHRTDLTDETKRADGWRNMPLHECMTLVDDSHRVSVDRSYPNLGIYSYARGLFHKPPIEGMNTSAPALRRVRAGQFIYSRLFAFEGAYGMVSQEYDGHFVSGEYPTFNCNPDKVNVEFLEAYFKSPSVWRAVAVGSKGLGNRRQRVQPAQILSHRAWVPPLAWQALIAQTRTRRDELKHLHDETAAELDSLMPSVLDRAFKGKL